MKKSKKDKKEKRHKKDKKSKKHLKKVEAESSSSSDSGESANEWVEKGTIPDKPLEQSKQTPSSLNPEGPQRDEWMTAPCMFACVTRDQLRAAKQTTEKQKEAQAAKYMLDTPGQSDRELNPFWANSGTGLPSEERLEPASPSLNAYAVGDQGAGWLRRALQRAKEQAAETGRSLDEVAAERWGSLQKLQDLISEAEGRQVNLRQHRTDDRRGDRGRDIKNDGNSEKRGWRENRMERRDKEDYRRNDGHERRGSSYNQGELGSDKRNEKHGRRDERYDRRDERYHRSDDRHDREENVSRRPYRDESHDSSSGRQRLAFKKPGKDNESPGSEYRHSQGASKHRNWQKKSGTGNLETQEFNEKPSTRELKAASPSSSSSASDADTSEDKHAASIQPEPEVLTDQQMNELAAKLVKAEILGNEDLIALLQKKLEAARQARAANPKAIASTSDTKKSEKDVVILTHTDSKGFTRPLQTKSAHPEPVGGRRRREKAETHASDGQRVRYFPDDDKYSLQDMFQREKLTTTEDSNEMFTKLAGKDGRQEHDNDMDDIFSERARQKESDGKIEARERGRAIQEHKRKERVLDSCKWCFDGKELQRHLIVAVGAKSYLCLPPYQSLTEGHCLIIPLNHVTCSTQLDEDVWEEIQDFRKALVRMFASEDEDCVLFESAMYLNKFPHMVLHCIPLPREMGDMAPIYFKKAILECETEWSTNKKLVDLSKKDVRRAVPKGLPYFAVDFGNEGGYAHVIEEEKNFPSNFAQEIIGGMLDLDHNLWRKPRFENFDKQRHKVIDFSKKWQEFDFTKKSNKNKRMKMDDKDSSDLSD